ncbi:sensor histidine kinase [Auraticoccus monumenti]|uniref:histidine kinase n=1 Tax=Auraticoccus monumenti TaxID=675864 RepID=A0A1G6STM9_9ACTN|nr:ATP-binding protein [Auraticoccus monumenti]SDD19636.1 two-component system, OmpR family, sensor histidine kinase MprB [Auraticoccus monumenti]
MIWQWLGSPTLGRRISVLTALAVACTVALTGVAGWLVTRVSLYQQLDDELTEIASFTSDSVSADISTLGGLDAEALRTVNVSLLVLGTDGSVRRVPGASTSLVWGAEEMAVARLGQGSSAREGRADNGNLYRIVAVPMEIEEEGSYALVIGRPLQPYTSILRSLALVMGTFGGLAAVGSAFIGYAVARSSLRPVRELSGAVSRVTVTDHLDPIEVHGDDELSQLTRSFNTMLSSLSLSRERQRRLIADAGHELRTPLTSLRTNIELLVADDRTGMLPEGARAEILRDVAAQLAEFTTLVGDLVQLAREDRVEPSPEPIDLREVTRNAIERARRRGPGLTFDVELNPLYLIGEPDTLERAITNLLDNAVKFSPPGGTVHVLLEGDRLRISDQGPGITDEDLPHIFDRFYRADSSRNTPGTGLGLSIVATTVARHGGWVRAGRSAEGGAEFTVQLPGSTTLAEVDDEGDETQILTRISD